MSLGLIVCLNLQAGYYAHVYVSVCKFVPVFSRQLFCVRCLYIVLSLVLIPFSISQIGEEDNEELAEIIKGLTEITAEGIHYRLHRKDCSIVYCCV